MSTAIINPSLADRTISIDAVRPHPDNYNRHDLDKIKQSLRVNGQYRPIVVDEETMYVLAGNGTWAAARALGWEHIAADVIRVGPDAAKRILLVDNFAATDDFDWHAVKAILDDLGGPVDGAGFDADDYASLLKRLDPGDGDGSSKLDETGVYTVIVDCDDEDHQAQLLARFDADGLSARPFMM